MSQARNATTTAMEALYGKDRQQAAASIAAQHRVVHALKDTNTQPLSYVSEAKDAFVDVTPYFSPTKQSAYSVHCQLVCSLRALVFLHPPHSYIRSSLGCCAAAFNQSRGRFSTSRFIQSTSLIPISNTQ